MMRTPLLVLSAIGWLAAGAAGQSQEEFEKMRARKRAAPFLEKGGWVTDLAVAKRLAAAKDKLILVYFTRSYSTPPPCTELEEKVLATPEVAALGDRVVLFCHITSGVEGDADQDLLSRYGGRQFPYFIGLDEEARPVAQFGHPYTVAGMKKFVEEDLAAYALLRSRSKTGSKKDKAAFLLRRIELGHLTPARIEEVLQTVDYLTDAQRLAIHRGMVRLELRAVLDSFDPDNPASVASAAKYLLGMKEKGRIPTGGEAIMFWQVLLGHAEASRDPALFREALEAIQKVPGSKPPADWVRKMHGRLKLLEWNARKGEDKPGKGR